jgi:hypothetical protein
MADLFLRSKPGWSKKLAAARDPHDAVLQNRRVVQLFLMGRISLKTLKR